MLMQAERLRRRDGQTEICDIVINARWAFN